MKKTSWLIVVLCVTLVAISVGSTFCARETYYAIVPTSLYEQADFDSDKIASIGQHQEMTLVTGKLVDGKWYEVSVFGKRGFVDSATIDVLSTEWQVEYEVMRVDAGGFSSTVNLYCYPTQDSAVYATLKDNTKLEVEITGVDYGEFSLVKYDGGEYYIMNKDLTTSLTYSQIVAIILGVIGGILVVALVFLLIYGYRLKLR